jgi:hypothetical protein
VANSFARRGESEARADGRPMVETRIERITKLLRKKAQPARPIQWNRSGSGGLRVSVSCIRLCAPTTGHVVPENDR